MNMDEITLYAYTFRSRAERVLWTLEELGFAYKLIRLDPFKGETQSEAFTALNPSRKIPVLTIGDKVLTESLPIMEYLNDRSPEAKLVPTDPDAVYVYKKAVHYGLTEIEPYLWLAEQASRLKSIYNWPEGTYAESVRKVDEHIPAVWEWLARSEYIAGDNFSLCDIYYYHLITWAKQHAISCPDIVGPYLERLEKRSAFPPTMRS